MRLQEILCPVCGRQFRPPQSSQKFCSRSCAYLGRCGSGLVHGEFRLFSGEYIRYESSYELVFLLYASNHREEYGNLQRCDFPIHYIHQNKRRRYFPDFLVEDTAGRSLLIEVKSTATVERDAARNQAKIQAAEKWCMENGHTFVYLDNNTDAFRNMCAYVARHHGLDILDAVKLFREATAVTLHCIRCGNLIPRGHSGTKAYLRRRFCSAVCRHLTPIRRRLPTSSHICPQCGQAFYGSRDRVYCSKICYTRSQRTMENKRCRICGREFMPGSRLQETCGKECGIVLRVQSRVVSGDFRRPEARFSVCLCCGKRFPSRSKTRKYCGTDCYHTGRKKHFYSVCPVCEGAFYNYTGRQTFCSRQCSGNPISGKSASDRK
jgi:hypothetical protein